MGLNLSGGVVCAGNIVYDIAVRQVEEIHWNTTAWVDTIEPHIGGNGANSAISLAKLKVPVRILGAIGPDPFGRFVLDILREAGCDTARVTKASSQTSTSVVLVNSRGDRSFQHLPGASREVFLAPIPFHSDLAGKHTHYHLANVFGVPGLRRHGGEGLRRARAAGLSTSLDTGWDAKGEWMTVLGPCLEYLDLLFVNEQEARMLSGSDDLGTAADFFKERGATNVVIKLGGKGCAVFEEAGEFRLPAIPVEVVDTTGAGDCFSGGFLAGLYYGEDWRGAAKWGNAAGALSVSKLGSTTGLLEKSAFLHFISTR